MRSPGCSCSFCLTIPHEKRNLYLRIIDIRTLVTTSSATRKPHTLSSPATPTSSSICYTFSMYLFPRRQPRWQAFMFQCSLSLIQCNPSLSTISGLFLPTNHFFNWISSNHLFPLTHHCCYSSLRPRPAEHQICPEFFVTTSTFNHCHRRRRRRRRHRRSSDSESCCLPSCLMAWRMSCEKVLHPLFATARLPSGLLPQFSVSCLPPPPPLPPLPPK